MPGSDSPRRYLVTGGAGFIGSHLCEALLNRGHSVTIVDDLSTGRFDNIRHLVEAYGPQSGNRFRFAIDSISNQGVLDRLASECNTIIHLAAAVGVRLIVEQPVHTIETNVMGTENVLMVARRYRCKVILASTSEVYGKGNQVPFSEEDDVVLGPTVRNRWAYAASKMLDEFLALAYHREHGLPVVVVRLFNTVGPRQTGRYGMVIPRFVDQALTGDPLTVFGDGRQTRCFLHVKDAVQGILALEDSSDAVGQVFNLGATREISIRELADEVLSCAGVEGSVKLVPYEEAYAAGFEDMRRRAPAIDKIRALTGWQPRRTLRDILRDTIEDQRAERSSPSPRESDAANR